MKNTGLWISLAVMACSQPAIEEPLSKDPVEVSAVVDRALATIGDHLQLSISIDHDTSYELEIPETVEVVGSVELLDESKETIPVGEGRREERWSLSFKANNVGSVLVEPLEIRYREDENSVWQSMTTGRIFVEVQSVLGEAGEPSEIRDIKPLVPLPKKTPWVPILAAIALVTVASVFLYLSWRRRQRIEEGIAVIPPWERALRDLEHLRSMPVESWNAVHDYYYRLSEVVRVWAEARFVFNATDLTSDEIIRELPGLRGLTETSRNRFQHFLEASDQVKYAARLPDAESIEGHWHQARIFVEETRPPREDNEEGTT